MTDKQKQHLLGYLGYYAGVPDGIWGRLSREATKEFQTGYGLEADGVCGPMTQKMLIGAIAGTVVKVERPAESKSADTGKPQTGTFWDEITWFKREEFRCKWGGRYCDGYPAEPDERMVRIANQLRNNLGVPVTIVSGLRCKDWNAIQGGVPNSQHMYGEAADIYAKGVPQSRVEAELDKIGGVRYHYSIKGSSNVHFDVPKGNR